MEENYRYQLHHQPEQKTTRPSRLRLRNTGGGEIVEVQGGHIIRSTGLKDRHSKVCTAKGPRDRRVRLSAHTAIQFYDVQDRLGYDRPSKAVDWLIKNAKASIDELAELPAWTPTAGSQNPSSHRLKERLKEIQDQEDDDIVNNQMGCAENSFFPAGGSSTPAGNLNEELKLSLQSFQDPMPHHQSIQESNNNNNNIYFDGSGWPENGGFSGFVFNSPAAPTQTTPFLQPLFGQPTNNQLLNYISQRGPLQSSNSPPVRAWVDPFAASAIDHHQTLAFHHPPSMPGFSSGTGGFNIPARIGGDDEEEEEHDKPSPASSDSHH